VQAVLDTLANDNLQNDERFAEMLVRSRVGKGYGPNYIQQELATKGISQNLIEQTMDATLEELDIDWQQQAQELVARRHSNCHESAQAWQRAARFLQRRGFAADVVRRALGDLPHT